MDCFLLLVLAMIIQSVFCAKYKVGDCVQVGVISLEDMHQVGIVMKVEKPKNLDGTESALYWVMLENGSKVSQKEEDLKKASDVGPAICTERGLAFYQGEFVEVLQPHQYAGLKAKIMHLDREDGVFQGVWLHGACSVGGAKVPRRPLRFKLEDIRKCNPVTPVLVQALPSMRDGSDNRANEEWEDVADEIMGWDVEDDEIFGTGSGEDAY